MRVPGRVYASEAMMRELERHKSLEQVRNVAHLPGISRRRWRCPTCTGATVSRSAASPPSTPWRVCSRRGGASATTSTAGADPGAVSARAKERGLPQLGSLGSDNHFCEVGYVAEIFDAPAAAAFGLELGKVTVLLRSGSRGLGHQVCDDALKSMLAPSRRCGIALPDRQLSAAPLSSPEAQAYFSAMAAAIKYAFANRQVMTHHVRERLARFFGETEASLDLRLVYDVCHDIAKWETHEIGGVPRRVCVHRDGATRAFGPGHPDVPEPYRAVGQPVLVPGDMGRYSFVLTGTTRAMQETFGSSGHGAGRHLSRAAAKQLAAGRPIFRELEASRPSARSLRGPSPRPPARTPRPRRLRAADRRTAARGPAQHVERGSGVIARGAQRPLGASMIATTSSRRSGFFRQTSASSVSRTASSCAGELPVTSTRRMFGARVFTCSSRARPSSPVMRRSVRMRSKRSRSSRSSAASPLSTATTAKRRPSIRWCARRTIGSSSTSRSEPSESVALVAWAR
jgi:hypothetical protein